MSCILHIETSTRVCSVALSQDGVCLTEEEKKDGPSHAAVLAPFVKEALSFADSHAIPLDAVALSQGPGSYTGLRIGSSTAKGVCYGRGVKLIAIPTLKIMCTPVLLYHEEVCDDALLCPMLDARRMEVYSAIYDRGLKEIRPTQAEILTENSYAEYLERGPVFFFGEGAEKFQALTHHPNAHFIEGIYPAARYMLPLAEMAMAREKFQDVAYFEPYYLKDFIAGTPRKNILFNS